jgi:hypothetical protein
LAAAIVAFDGTPVASLVFVLLLPALASLTQEDTAPADALPPTTSESSTSLDASGDDGHDIEVLEQLLFMENAEAAFDMAKRDDEDKLREVDEQISTKEGLLKRLQGSLEYFQTMQAKYDEIVEELRRTEEEKATLEKRIREAEQVAASKKVRSCVFVMSVGLVATLSLANTTGSVCSQGS